MHTISMNGEHTILIVEDETLIALAIEMGLEDEGYNVLGPVATVESGLQLIQYFDLDAAILDVDLGQGCNSFALAEVLQARNIPFLFHTGRVPYEAISETFGEAIVVSKPTYLPRLIAHLQRMTQNVI